MSQQQSLSTVELSELTGQHEFESAIVNALDMDSWSIGQNMKEVYERLENEVRESVENESLSIKTIREEIMPRIVAKAPVSPEIAQFQFTSEQIEKAHRGLLFNGGTEAVDGTIVIHDTLPLTVTQIGVCLVSYNGEQGSYMHRIYRKDLKIKGENLLDEVLELLEQRRKRGSQGLEEQSPQFTSALAQRGLMAYAERAILMDKSKARWRLGHGNPFPYELLTSFWASRTDMTKSAIALFEKIVKHKRFVFVPSAPSRRELITIGSALRPLEYIIISSMRPELENIIERGGVRGDKRQIQEYFVDQYGDNVVLGLFRASEYAPAYIFYAHKDHVQTAALVAIADSVLQEHRGFPMLIDIADNICHTTFNPETFYSTIQQAYAEAGQPFRYLGERETRSR